MLKFEHILRVLLYNKPCIAFIYQLKAYFGVDGKLFNLNTRLNVQTLVGDGIW